MFVSELHLLEANDNLKSLSQEVEDVGEERLAVYNAFKAVTGLGDPLSKKLQDKNVRGILGRLLGSSPKQGVVQRRLLSTTVDLVGRGVVAPNPDLDMDHVAIPEDKAWDIYKNFFARRLRRKGLPLSVALKNIEQRSKLARDEMQAEMQDRPVLLSRSPVLHKLGIMAFWPKLTKGSAIQVCTFVQGGTSDVTRHISRYVSYPYRDPSQFECSPRHGARKGLVAPTHRKSILADRTSVR